MTQENHQTRVDHSAIRNGAKRQPVFIARENPSEYLSPRSVVPGDASFTRGNSDMRSDNIVSALREGASEIVDRAKNHLGYMNSREELLLDMECRKLLDILPYPPSREETLANIIRRECKSMTPEEQFELACLDKNIDPAVIKPMLIETKKTPKVAEEPKETPREEVVNNAVNAMYYESVVPTSKQTAQTANKGSIFLPGFKAPEAQTALPEKKEKVVHLKCSVGVFQLPVLDVIVEDEYVVIVQKKDASFLFSPERDGKEHRLDVIDADLVFSGIAYEFDGAIHTIMIIRRNH
jgi:hypothetical protein